MLYDEHGVRVFLFQDDDFPLWGRAGAKWVDELAHRLRAADLAERVLWKISCARSTSSRNSSLRWLPPADRRGRYGGRPVPPDAPVRRDADPRATGQRGPVEGQRHAPGLRLPRSAAECLPPAARCRCEALDPQRRHLPSTELGLGRVLHSPPPRAGSHGRAGVRQALRGLPARTCTPDCCDCATASCGTTSMRWSTRSRSATCTDR